MFREHRIDWEIGMFMYLVHELDHVMFLGPVRYYRPLNPCFWPLGPDDQPSRTPVYSPTATTHSFTISFIMNVLGLLVSLVAMVNAAPALDHRTLSLYNPQLGIFLTTGQLETRVSAASNPSSGGLNPYPTKPRLTFNPSGTFKITIFSDLHYGENPWDSWGPQQDVNSTRLMRTVLVDERPDYVYAWSYPLSD